MTHGLTLTEHAVRDWTRLIRGLTNAGAMLSDHGREPSGAVAMVARMLKRAVRDGAQALAWAGQPLQLAQVVAGPNRGRRTAFASSAELDACRPQLPAELDRVARAFVDDDDRRPALVAMFIEAGRRAEQLLEQIELAAANDAAVEPAAMVLARALPRAWLKSFKPQGMADFDRVRAVGYVQAGKAGRIVEVRRPGLVWHGHVVRKADVVVSECSELLNGSITIGRRG